jgi:type II secretory pathway component PulJ
MMVVMGLLSIILGIVLAALVTMQNTENRVNNRSQTNDQVRLAVEQIDRQIRSGNLIYPPNQEGNNAGTGIPAGFSMRVYTQANGDEKCVQWRVTGGALQTRSWEPIPDGAVSGWRTVADHIVNTTASPPFVLDTTSSYGGRLINVDVIANQRTNTGANVEGKSSITGRNQVGYGDVCTSTMPPP